VLLEAEFWVAIAFVLFCAILVYAKVHTYLLDSIDQRRNQIKAELDEAQRLKQEAEQLLAEYRRKQDDAEREAQELIAGAQAEVERLATEAKAKMEEFVSRRTKMAETKIAQAEAQALADVRAAAAEAAVAAAEKILTRAAKGKVAEDLLNQGIEDVKKKFN
jgi:F-type H+-transporting ATPase subunit b